MLFLRRICLVYSLFWQGIASALPPDSVAAATPTVAPQLADELSLDSQARVDAMPFMRLAMQHPFVDEEEFDPLLPPVYAIKKIPQANNLLIFFIVINILAVVAFVKASNERGVYNYIRTLFSNGLAFKYVHDHKLIFHPTLIQLMLVTTVTLSLTVFLTPAVPWFSGITPPPLRFIAILVFIMVVYLVKAVTHSLLGYMFQVEKLGFIVMHHTIGCNFLFSLVFFPFFLINYLNQQTITNSQMKGILVALVLVAVLYRLMRVAWVLIYSFPYSKIYLALYLCTVEILPWFVALKLIAS